MSGTTSPGRQPDPQWRQWGRARSFSGTASVPSPWPCQTGGGPTFSFPQDPVPPGPSPARAQSRARPVPRPPSPARCCGPRASRTPPTCSSWSGRNHAFDGAFATTGSPLRAVDARSDIPSSSERSSPRCYGLVVRGTLSAGGPRQRRSKREPRSAAMLPVGARPYL
jgi:hypothetical protein